jgi:HEPN domain-containing protein
MKYSFAAAAAEDLQAAVQLQSVGLHNHAVRLCKEYVEKIMKECLQKKGKGDDLLLLHTDKMSRLVGRAGELSDLKFAQEELGFLRALSEFYSRTGHGSDNYLNITKEQADMVLNGTLKFQAAYEARLVRGS